MPQGGRAIGAASSLLRAAVSSASPIISGDAATSRYASLASVNPATAAAATSSLARAVAAASAPTVAAAATGNAGNFVLFDDFPGSSLNGSNWTGPFDRMSDQVNGEINALTPSNVTVASSKLTITARVQTVQSNDRDETAPHNFLTPLQTFNYTSGQIQSVASFTFGTISARIKVPGGAGVWPCFWMLGTNWQASQPYTANDSTGAASWPAAGWNEIDIAEFFQGHRSVVNCSNHYGSSDGLHEQSLLGFDPTAQFIVYRLQWTSTSLIWSFDAEDGNGFHTLRSLSSNIPQNAMYVILNMAVGGNGGGTPNNPDFPLSMDVDWVRVTQP